MTDRGRAALRAEPDTLTIGPSSMRWEGDRLVIEIDEISGPPVISRVRGTVTLTPRAVTGVELALTPDGAHVWRPFAPVADISVRLDADGWQWDGHGYFDANFGLRPLEADFDFWTWGRFPTAAGATCFYDAEMRDGSTVRTAIAFAPDGTAHATEAPPLTPFARSGWRVRRATRADPGTTPRQVKPMLDAPFYARALVETRLNAETVTGVHEALDLTRFRRPWLKPMLAFRVPRRAGWNSGG